MPSFDNNAIIKIFFATWVVLALAMLLVHLRASTRVKVKTYRYGPIVIGLLFLSFICLIDRKDFYFAIPAVALITWLNIKTIKFCPACGRMNRSPTMFPVPRHCVHCGAEIEPHRPGAAT